MTESTPMIHRVKITYTPSDKYRGRMTHYECSCGTWNYRHAGHIFMELDPLMEVARHFADAEGTTVYGLPF